MRTPKYKFLLNGVEIFPHYKQLKKKYAKENGQNFFIETLDGKITLHGSDYRDIRQSSLEQIHVFEIQKYSHVTGKYAQYFVSTFNKTDCKFDDDKRSLELKFKGKNQYSSILDGYDNKYDLVKLAPALTRVSITKRPLTQVYIRGGNSISNFIGGTYWESDINASVESHKELISKYYFSYYKTFNEIRIVNSRISEVNGIYAGSDKKLRARNNYSIELEFIGSVLGTDNYRLKILDADSQVLYLSDSLAIVKKGSTDVYITSSSSFNFTNPNIADDKCKTEYIFEYAIYQRLLCDTESINTGNGTLNTYKLPAEDISPNNSNYKYAIGLEGNTIAVTSRTVDEPTEYGMDDFGRYFTNNFLPASAGFERFLPVCRSTWANASIWFSYGFGYKFYEASARKKYTIKDTYFIADVIKALLKKVNPDITHEATPEYSIFLYTEPSPLGLASFKLLMAPKTNILKGEYDYPAKKGEISLKEVFDMLRNCFRCYWFIDTENRLRIEHISWFMKGKSYTQTQQPVGLDLTSLLMNTNSKTLAFSQNTIEYNKQDLPARYEFSWMDDVTELFGGIYIDVKSNYVKKGKTESINVSAFTPDIDFMLLEPSRFSKDGFALLGAIGNSMNTLELPIIDLELRDTNGNSYVSSIQNGYMSWAYLLNYYMYDMPSYSISSDAGLYYIVRGLAYTMQQKIKFPCEEDPDLYKLVKTELGEGLIGSMSIDLDTRQVEAELLFKPE